nr:PREDICTED: apyrase-like isoform X2 [Bemisia tabaci]
MIRELSLSIYFMHIVIAQNDVFNLTIIHFNDFHAKFEAVNARTSDDCKKDRNETCVGGFARLYTLSRWLKRENPSALLLNAGDVFTGSFWYRLFKGNVTSYFMNKLPVDAMTIGNHEFDDRIDEVVNYLSRLKLPVLVANINSTEEPTLTPYVKKSAIYEVDGKKVGIIGFVTKMFREIASVGRLKIEDEVSTVNAEAKSLRALGAEILIGLSHAGFSEDKRIGKSIDVDVIVGGHSHTLLYTGTPPLSDVPESDYPTVIEQESRRKVLIVQAGAFSKYLGYLTITFDQNNTIQSWTGNPILLDNTVEEDPSILQEMEPWRKEVHEIGDRVIGETLVFLDGRQWVCRIDLTYAKLLDTLPFSETYDLVELSGKHLLQVMEFAVASLKSSFLQYSGIKATIDLDGPKYHRVSNVSVRCADCVVPLYRPLEKGQFYKIVLPSFVCEGGDGYKMIKKNARRHVKGRVNTEILQDYLSVFSPVFIESEGNIIVHASRKIVDKIKTLYPKPATGNI